MIHFEWHEEEEYRCLSVRIKRSYFSKKMCLVFSTALYDKERNLMYLPNRAKNTEEKDFLKRYYKTGVNRGFHIGALKCFCYLECVPGRIETTISASAAQYYTFNEERNISW